MTMQTKIANVATAIPGPKSAALIERWHQFEADTTGRQVPVVWDRARGVTVDDVDGNRFIDWTSGVLVTNLGHCHPKLVEAVRESVGRLINNYECANENRIRAAEALVAALPGHLDKCFFLTTGSEATESCLRIMKRKTGCFETIGFHGGFHGRTSGAASAGGLSGTKRGYGPALPGVIRAPFPYPYRCPVQGDDGRIIDYYMSQLDETVAANSCGSLAGIMVEPYLGAAGFIFPPDGYMKELERWCREKSIVFTLDEVQSSYGRMGRMWGMEVEGVTPDLVSIGKGIGNGVPVAAVAARGDVIDCLGKGEMSSTVGGNPISSAAVIAILEAMVEDRIVENVQRVGPLMLDRLRAMQEKSRYLGDVRGKGLVIGLEIVEDKKTKAPSPDLTRQLMQRCAENGVLIGSVGIYGNVVRVAPPLCITEDEANESLDIMAKSLTSLEG